MPRPLRADWQALAAPAPRRSPRSGAKMSPDALESVGKMGHQLEPLSRDGMREAEFRRMQRHTIEAGDEIGQHPIGPTRFPSATVGLITEERVPQGRQVNADLVGASGLQAAFQKA